MKITLRESAFCILISHVGCFNLPPSMSTQAAASAQGPDRHLLLSPRWFGFCYIKDLCLLEATVCAARGVSITADAVAVRVGPCVVYIGWVGGGGAGVIH